MNGTLETTLFGSPAKPEALANGMRWWSRRRDSGDHVLVFCGLEIGPGMTARQAKSLAEWLEVAESVPSHIADRLVEIAARLPDADRSVVLMAVMLIRGPDALPAGKRESSARTRAERDRRAQNLYELESDDDDDVG